jgi:hypothetical protein
MHIINYCYVLLAIKGSKLAHLWKIPSAGHFQVVLGLLQLIPCVGGRSFPLINWN